MISNLPLVVDPTSLPVKTVTEFIAYAKANPGKISMASGGNGSTSHIGGELFKMMTGIDMVHVPYRGGAPALTDLIAGEVQVMFSPLPESLAAIQAGTVRALAVTTAQRSAVLPQVPAAAESVPGFEASTWQGIGAPTGTPASIVTTLNQEINAGIGNSGIKFRLAALGSLPTPMSPEAFKAYIVDETAKWAKAIHQANIKLE